MMDVGWSELLLIGIVALIVVGPKDLPKLFHSFGRITAKARAMAREFSSAMEDAAKNSGLDDAANTLRDVKSLTSKKALGLDALERATDKFEKWDPVKAARHQTPAATPSKPSAPVTPVTSPSAPASNSASDSAPDPDLLLDPKGTDVPRDHAAPDRAPTDAQTPPSQPTVAPDSEAPTGQRRLHAVRRTDTKDL